MNELIDQLSGDGALLPFQKRVRGGFHDRQRELRQQDRILQRPVEIWIHVQSKSSRVHRPGQIHGHELQFPDSNR